MTARCCRSKERGFALLAVLWIITALSTAAMSVSLLAREQILAASNRGSLLRARFHADDCLERGKSALAAALTPQIGESFTGVLRVEDLATHLSYFLPPEIAAICTLQFRAAGAAIDLNSADLRTIQRYLTLRGVRSDLASSFVRELGLRRGDAFSGTSPAVPSVDLTPEERLRKRHPIGDLRELEEINGWQEIQNAAPELGIDGARIPLNYASTEVLMSLPGFTQEAVARLVEMRSENERISNLQDFALRLSGEARDSLAANLASLTAITTSDPGGWVMKSIAQSGDPQVTVTVEILIRWGQNRGSVERRRIWVG